VTDEDALPDGVKYLYHTAPQCALESIAKKGLLRNFDGVYACQSPEASAGFMASRLFLHFHAGVGRDGNGDWLPHDEAHVYQIDVDKTDREKWEKSYDHSPAFFGDDSWLYDGTIPPQALKVYGIITKKQSS
jgi:hypothetical protein